VSSQAPFATPRRVAGSNSETAVSVPKSHRIVAVYEQHRDAEDAVFRLSEAGFVVEDASIVARGFASERWLRGDVPDESDPHEPPAWTGGVLGMLVGAAFVWIPGVGPLAFTGSLASMLIGAAGSGSELGRVLGELGLTPGGRTSSTGYLVVLNATIEAASRAARILSSSTVTDPPTA
jgi:hypothetical protein